MTAATAAPIQSMPWEDSLTWDDLEAMPEDGNIYEIIDGELWVMAPPIPVHQGLSTRLLVAFYNASEAQGLGRVFASPIGVRLGVHDVVQPDLLFISRERLGIQKKKLIDGAPDIVLEIFSPSTRSKDRGEKAALYARSGVREYRQVDPRHRSVVVLALRDGAYEPLPQEGNLARSAVLPDLPVDVVALFENLT